jgi:hypothetical protein
LAAVPPQTVLAEWTLEQIAREVIKYANEESKQGRSLRQWGVLAGMANTLRDLEGEIYTRLVGGRKIRLEMMRISHRQFVWQQQRLHQRWIIRYYKLFNTPSIDALLQRATELTVDQIYLIGMSYLGKFLQRPDVMQQAKVEIPGLTGQHFDLFLRFTSLSFGELRNKLRAEHALDADFAYRYSSLREFPLIRMSHKGLVEIVCPIPMLLFWRMTSGLYYTLKDQQGFANPFGESFQRYVGEVLRHRMTNEAMQILQESEYQVGSQRKDTVDWIVSQGEEAALFVECKTKRLTWASKVSLADLTALEQDMRKLAGAVTQVYRTIIDYRENRYPHLRFTPGRHIYPVIVTLEDWYLFGPDLPKRLEEAVRTDMVAADLPINWLEEMPYSIMSVDDFETVTGVINTVGVQPFISGKLDLKYLYWPYGTYCHDRYAAEVGNLPPLFDNEFEAMFAELLE